MSYAANKARKIVSDFEKVVALPVEVADSLFHAIKDAIQKARNDAKATVMAGDPD